MKPYPLTSLTERRVNPRLPGMIVRESADPYSPAQPHTASNELGGGNISFEGPEPLEGDDGNPLQAAAIIIGAALLAVVCFGVVVGTIIHAGLLP